MIIKIRRKRNKWECTQLEREVDIGIQQKFFFILIYFNVALLFLAFTLLLIVLLYFPLLSGLHQGMNFPKINNIASARSAGSFNLRCIEEEKGPKPQTRKQIERMRSQLIWQCRQANMHALTTRKYKQQILKGNQTRKVTKNTRKANQELSPEIQMKEIIES